MTIEAIEQALELRALADKFSEGWHDGIKIDASDIMLLTQVANAIEDAEKQEPVALMVVNGEISYKSTDDDQSFGMWCPVNYDSSHSFPDGTKFYIHPQPKREWVGLTPADFDKLEQLFGNKVSNDFVFADIVCVISAKLKDKNGF
jgi:hypothetical protein